MMEQRSCEITIWSDYLRCAPILVHSGLSSLVAIVTSPAFSWIGSLLISFILYHLWHVYTNAKDPRSMLPLPPGSMGLPLLGETLNFFMKGSEFFGERTRAHGRVYKTHLLGQRTIRVTGAGPVSRILRGEGTLVASQWPPSVRLILGDGALAHSSGRQHQLRRRLVSEAFAPAALRRYAPGVQLTCRRFVRTWCREGAVLGYPAARSLTFTLAAQSLLGLDVTDRRKAQMLVMFEDMLSTLFSMPVPIPGIGLYRGMKARARIMSEIGSCIEERQKSDALRSPDRAQDALTALLAAAAASDGSGEALTEQEVKDSALEMLFAGHLPTSSATCSILMYLAMNPKVMDKILVEIYDNDLLEIKDENEADITLEKLAELTYVDAVIKEVLRLAPPVGAGYRKALKTFEIDGCQIPKDWTVIYSIRETQNTAEAGELDGADKFNPDRWMPTLRPNKDRRLVPVPALDAKDNFSYVPFGYGDRSCVGQEFVRLTLKTLIVELVRSSTWRLSDGNAKAAPQMIYMPVPRPSDNLPLQFREVEADLRRRAFSMSW